MSQTLNTAIAVIGIDIGKNSFHIVGHDKHGAIVLRQKWSRGQVEARLANLPPCLIGMEACVGAHHLSRKLNSLGHDARLMPAKYVRPYSKGQKNDFRDAEAIAEAVQRPTMKFVATKTADQLDLKALHTVFRQEDLMRKQPAQIVTDKRSPVVQGVNQSATGILTTAALAPSTHSGAQLLRCQWSRLSVIRATDAVSASLCCALLGSLHGAVPLRRATDLVR